LQADRTFLPGTPRPLDAYAYACSLRNIFDAQKLARHTGQEGIDCEV